MGHVCRQEQVVFAVRDAEPSSPPVEKIRIGENPRSARKLSSQKKIAPCEMAELIDAKCISAARAIVTLRGNKARRGKSVAALTQPSPQQMNVSLAVEGRPASRRPPPEQHALDESLPAPAQISTSSPPSPCSRISHFNESAHHALEEFPEPKRTATDPASWGFR
ncbi:hypothetical protein H8A95_20555 [Bradyrhizobium sp. Pear76]|uniref:hypothetical protein n=1 Tax=Bradyrhizobium oropedii TaxID=1571201 RepID=UPI001E2A6D45|nr:hypothetical protein [Bradyrhizobium oropedii]MCC8964640.1 hypothetical protein [Bradyrhizobium oropedii]